ncbi:unnamed protein product [Camellia sinensis]
MFSHCGRSKTSGLTWEEGKALLRENIRLRDLQDDFLDQLYALDKVLKSSCGRRNGGGGAVAVAVARCNSRSITVAVVRCNGRSITVMNTKTAQQDQPTKAPKQRVQVPQRDAENSQQDAPKPNVLLRDQNPTQLKLQDKEYVQNQLKENDCQITKDEKPPIEAPCIELEKAKGEIKEIVIPYALESNESKRAMLV